MIPLKLSLVREKLGSDDDTMRDKAQRAAEKISENIKASNDGPKSPSPMHDAAKKSENIENSNPSFEKK